MNPTLNILLIEDNPADSKLVSIFLKGVYSGLSTLITADSLVKGLQLLEGTTYDVIILDLTLPDSWGLETFNKLHAKVPDIPIIVLTGTEDETIGVDSVKLGAQDFLLKGKINDRELQRSINYSIERHKLLQSLAEKTNSLYKERQKLAEAQKLAHIGSWEWDLQNDTISWSDEFFRIHGMNPQEEVLQPDKVQSYIHADDRDYLKNIIQNLVKADNQSTFTYRIVRKDGSIRTLYSGAEAIKNDKGVVIKIAGIGQDITERIKEEEMEKLASAATKSFNSVIITDEHGNIEWINEGFSTLTGYTLEEVKGSHGESLRKGAHTGISEDANYYKKVINEKIPVTYESKNYSKQGKEYWTITTLTPVLSRKGEVKRIIAIDSDITLRKQMEEELEKSVSVKEQFLANVSHEIRTPMNAIVGFTDLILKTSLSDEQKQYTEAIKTSGENLLVIINDILDFSKIQSGKIPFEKIEFSISQVVNTLTELMLPKSVEKNIKLSKSIDADVPDRLIGDPTRLNQILLNLVGNAIKFTQKGEVKISVGLASENSDMVNLTFSVSDTGIGITHEKLPEIFDAFTQATYATTRKYGGTGLGLAIVKQLVELLGGNIKVESELNKGSVFTFNLGYRKNDSPLNANKTVMKENENDVLKGLTVLLVEDNILNQLLAQKVLSDWGLKVEIADNGLIAIEKIEKQNFDLVLMDIQLPEMDGYEATHQIREKLLPPKSTIPIIAMTAHAISGEEEKCLKAGMNSYISKPFNPHNLYQKITSLLNISGNGVNNKEKGNNMGNNTHKHTDLAYLKQLANGSDEFIMQMLTLFIEQTPDTVVKMEKYLQERNLESLRKVAHKMKPSIMFVGLREIEKDVKAIENYASEGTHTDELPGMISHIKEVCNEAIGELKEEIELLK